MNMRLETQARRQRPGDRTFEIFQLGGITGKMILSTK